MEEELIGLEVATLAKKKRFNVPCFDYFIQDDFDNSSEKKQNHNLMSSVYSRPTQTVLQKWLRETHNIYVSIFTFVNDEEVYFDYSIKQKAPVFGFIDHSKKLHEYTTYELALEFGLLDALKLI